MAILLGILAVSDATKALQHLNDPSKLGMVIFGVRCQTFAANLILGLAMGAVLGAYAYGLWNLRCWVIPLAIAYAFYVPMNSDLFWYRHTGLDVPPLASMLISLAVGLIGSVGTGRLPSGAVRLRRDWRNASRIPLALSGGGKCRMNVLFAMAHRR